MYTQYVLYSIKSQLWLEESRKRMLLLDFTAEPAGPPRLLPPLHPPALEWVRNTRSLSYKCQHGILALSSPKLFQEGPNIENSIYLLALFTW